MRTDRASRCLLPCVLAVLAVAAGCGGGSGLTPITFLTNYVFIGRHAPFFVGTEKGFYREAGLDVTILPATGSAFVITAIEGGQADFGIAETASLVQAAGRGANVKAFGVFMDRSTSGLAALAPYPSPASVVGRQVAASLTDSARLILPIALSRHGLDPGAVAWVAADPAMYATLLLADDVDLITASIDSDVPALRRVAEPQGRQVHFSGFADWGYDVYGYLLIAHGDRLTSRPEEVRSFAAATARAVVYAIEHPEEAAEIIARYSPTLDRVTALAQWEASIPAIATATVAELGYGVATTDRLHASIDLVTEAFALETALTPADIYADGFMPR